MTDSILPPKVESRRAGRAARRSLVRSTVFLVAFVLGGVSLFFVACGDSTPETVDSGRSDPGTTETVSTIQTLDSEGLAAAVASTWAQAMKDLIALLEDRPAPGSALTQVKELKEDYVQQMVQLGHSRELLSAPDKAEANALVWSELMDFSEEPWFASYIELTDHYRGLDVKFANLLADFNVLTQYSDFELLRQQLPEEAARLGVE